MVPIDRETRLPSTIVAACPTERSHTVAVPAMVLPTTFPTAPITKANNMEATPTVTDDRVLAQITRCRLGTYVNVVSPLRWLHSLVIDSRATIGRITVIGNPTA